MVSSQNVEWRLDLILVWLFKLRDIARWIWCRFPWFWRLGKRL